MSKHNPSRRDFVKKAAYVAPAILSLRATSAFAKSGSGTELGNDDKESKRKRPKVKPSKTKRRS